MFAWTTSFESLPMIDMARTFINVRCNSVAQEVRSANHISVICLLLIAACRRDDSSAHITGTAGVSPSGRDHDGKDTYLAGRRSYVDLRRPREIAGTALRSSRKC